jgi:hypothetical protein
MNDHLSLNVSELDLMDILPTFGAGKKRGFWGYTKLVVQEYLRYSEFDSSLLIDGQ